jgi:hypothetical protein
LAASGSIPRTAVSTALMMRCRDQHCQPAIRSANEASTVAITSSLTNSVRAMISCTVRQSASPAANNAATLGSRVSNASAWPTSSVAPLGVMFIAADTSAVVRANPVIIEYPGSGSASPVSSIRHHNNAAIAAHRRAISADSCR